MNSLQSLVNENQDYFYSKEVVNNFFPVEEKIAKEPVTEEEKITNYITEKLAGRPFEDVQDVLIGVGLKLDAIVDSGEKIVAEDVIKDLENKKFL